jgi:hypothetical protein
MSSAPYTSVTVEADDSDDDIVVTAQTSLADKGKARADPDEPVPSSAGVSGSIGRQQQSQRQTIGGIGLETRTGAAVSTLDEPLTATLVCFGSEAVQSQLVLIMRAGSAARP